MSHRIGSLYVVLLLTAGTAVADILPPPDKGPRAGTAGGLNFTIESVSVEMPGGYTKSTEVVVLTGCVDGHHNCVLARSRHVIGWEVQAVDGHGLDPTKGRITQLLDAFAAKRGGTSVALELWRPGPDGKPVTVAFSTD